LLEELGLAYTVKPVNIRQGEQKPLEFLTLNPNGKVHRI
jgi:GSH-dependent disulfide-bond oxidoreductase